MLKTYEVNLDLEKELYSPSNILFNVSRNDYATVQILFTISQDGAAFNLTGKTVELAIKKPSGLTVYQEVQITEAIAGKAEVQLVLQAYTEYGIYTAEVYVRDVDQIAVTSPFYYAAREAVILEETVDSINDWSGLQQALLAYDLKPVITSGFPTITPQYIGQIAFDEVNNIAYIANDLLSTAWQTIGGGEGGGGNDDILGTGAPTATPVRIGQVYIDTEGAAAYIATGATADNWEQIDAAGIASVDWTEILNKPSAFTPEIHTHDFVDITGKPVTYPADAHTHAIADVTNLQTTLDGKADDADLAGKANTIHTHAIADVTNLQTTLDSKADDADLAGKADAANVYTKAETYNKTEVDQMVIEGGGTVVEDVLTSISTVNALSANQGRVLKEQVDGKAADAHTHAIADITNLQTTLDGKADDADLTGKSDVGHTHAYANITEKPTTFAPDAHTHAIADVTNLQITLDGKADDAHTHAIADVTNLQITLDGKSDVGHTHAYADITEKPTTFAPDAHTHAIADVTNLQTTLDGKADDADLAGKANTIHTHAIADVTNLQTTLDGKQPKPISVTATPITTPTHAGQMAIDSTNKNTYIAEGTAAGDWKRLIDDADLSTKANTTHTHAIADVTNLQTTLDGKADDAHTHAIADVTNLQTTLDGKADDAHTHAIADVTNLQTTLDGKADDAHTHAYADITSKPTTFTPPLMSGAVTGGAKVGNGLAMSTDYLFVKTLGTDGTKINTTNNNVAIDRATVDTWYAAKTHTHATADVTGLDTTLAGKQDKAGTGTAAPTTTPTYIGQINIDTTNKRTYIAEGTASSADWRRVAGTNYVDTGDNTIINTYLGGKKIWTGSQTTYDGLTKDANTLYFITG